MYLMDIPFFKDSQIIQATRDFPRLLDPILEVILDPILEVTLDPILEAVWPLILDPAPDQTLEHVLQLLFTNHQVV
jgi:hypothetical protein